MFTTALEQGELITAVEFPVPRRAAYEKFRNPASRYAIVGVFVAKTAGGVRVAVTGAGQSGVFRHTAMEQALTANFSPDAIANVTTPAGRAEQRHPRQRRISRAPGGRDGEARRRSGVLSPACGGSATTAVPRSIRRSIQTNPGAIGAGSARTKRAWKTPRREIAMRRLARAEALGISYRAYTLEILERGVHL